MFLSNSHTYNLRQKDFYQPSFNTAVSYPRKTLNLIPRSKTLEQDTKQGQIGCLKQWKAQLRSLSPLQNFCLTRKIKLHSDVRLSMIQLDTADRAVFNWVTKVIRQIPWFWILLWFEIGELVNNWFGFGRGTRLKTALYTWTIWILTLIFCICRTLHLHRLSLKGVYSKFLLMCWLASYIENDR